MRLIDRPSVHPGSWPPMARVRGWIEAAWNARRHLPGADRWSGRDRSEQAAAEESGTGPLEQVIDDLRNLNRNTEKDFLEIGGKLMGFIQTAESISSGLNSLTLLISGDRSHHASEVLARALERCREMEGRAVGVSRDLRSLREGAVSVCATFAGFRDSLATFRVLCILTRVETARLGGAGINFGSLIEDVRSLAESMDAKVENVIEASAQLDDRIEQTLGQLSEVDVVLAKLSAVITEVIGSLAAFSARQADAATVSVRLASDSDSVSASIKEAVTSIQFHDITRQQVEHVIDALVRVDSETKRRGSTLSREAAAVLALQASQLADAESKFVSSVARLSGNLDNIAARVDDMNGNGQTLLAASGSGEDSFFLKLEQCLTTILHAAGSSCTALGATSVAAGELGVTLESMREASAQITASDAQLQRLALNAGIRSAHIGAKGDTLAVLSGALEDLAANSSRRSDVAAEALRSMSTLVARLSERRDDSVCARLTNKEDSLVDEMRSTIEELHSWSEAGFVRSTEIACRASGLREEISAVRSAFGAGRLFTEVVARCREVLLRLAAEAVPASREEGKDRAGPELEDFAKHYTMQAEREVHAAVIQAAAAEPAQRLSGEVSGAVPEDAAELGDNVELF